MTDAERIVAVAVDSADEPQVLDVLSSAGFAVVPVPDIASVADRVAGNPFVVIVDDAEGSWLRDVADLLRARPDARVLALVDIASSAEMMAAIGAGIGGFLSPSADADALVRTVRAMIESGVAIPRDLVSGLVEEVRGGRGRSVDTEAGSIEVTDREWEIVLLLLQRRSTREIAQLLYVSVGTVRSHISALGRKLGAADRADTIRLLQQRGH